MNDIALHEIEGAPRALDIDIGERLGMKRPTNIRGLIEANMAELAQFGDVARAECNVSMPNGGTKTVTEYHLNEEQALTIAQISRAPRAKEVRAMLVRVFVAYRRGLLTTDAELTRRLDGMVKMVAHKVTGIERMASLMAEAMARMDTEHNALAEQVRSLVVTSDPRHVATDMTTVLEVLEAAKVPAEHRDRINRRLGSAFRRTAEAEGVHTARAPWNRSTWLFHHEDVKRWLKAFGAAMIREHKEWLDRQKGQGTLSLVGGKALKAKPFLPDLMPAEFRDGMAVMVCGDEIVAFDTGDFEMKGGEEAVVIRPEAPGRNNGPRIERIDDHRFLRTIWGKRSAALMPIEHDGRPQPQIAYVLGRVLSRRKFSRPAAATA